MTVTLSVRTAAAFAGCVYPSARKVTTPGFDPDESVKLPGYVPALTRTVSPLWAALSACCGLPHAVAATYATVADARLQLPAPPSTQRFALPLGGTPPPPLGHELVDPETVARPDVFPAASYA